MAAPLHGSEDDAVKATISKDESHGSNLLDLPMEILTLILSHLESKGLLSVCLTCKTLIFPAQQNLYQDIFWDLEARPLLLLRSILHRRELALFIRRMYLREAYVSEETLGMLLSATPGLKTLEYQFQCDVGLPAEGEQQSTHLRVPLLMSALEHVSHTLERLVISVEFYGLVGTDVTGGFPEQWGILGRCESMRHFKRLKYLEIPFVVLLGWRSIGLPDSELLDSLPTGLEELRLSNEMSSWSLFLWIDFVAVPQVRTYLEDEQPKQLRRLKLVRKEQGYIWKEDAQRDVQRVCERVGVEFILDVVEEVL
ncbi:MAG: hypothetical protein M1823_003131 [Watsoniomyces obsoletus]|nr:MAG: hypothetical protein M1823_003131 [Watsoniomyces obsoletus]